MLNLGLLVWVLGSKFALCDVNHFAFVDVILVVV